MTTKKNTPCAMTLKGAIASSSLPARFWTKVRADKSGCWLWTASTTDGGYGRFVVRRQNLRAHRLVYEDQVGAIPEDRELDHWCQVTRCVNPAHLRPATHAQNMRNQRHQGGRRYKGVTVVGDRWRAQIKVRGVKINLGLYGNDVEAAAAYNAAARQHFGEFAAVNEGLDDVVPRPLGRLRRRPQGTATASVLALRGTSGARGAGDP